MDIRIAAYGVILDEDRILLAHWREHGHSGWTLPGGGIDPGEDPADFDKLNEAVTRAATRRRTRKKKPSANS